MFLYFVISKANTEDKQHNNRTQIVYDKTLDP